MSIGSKKGENLTIGEEFALAYRGNENLAIPQFVGAGPFSVRLRNTVLDSDNADRDSNLNTDISANDIVIVASPDGGEVPGLDISVLAFNPDTNILTLGIQEGETVEAGEVYTVQYMNRQEATVPATATVTQERLYLEAMEEILPGISKIIVSPETESVIILGGQEGMVPVPIGPSLNP